MFMINHILFVAMLVGHVFQGISYFAFHEPGKGLNQQTCTSILRILRLPKYICRAWVSSCTSTSSILLPYVIPDNEMKINEKENGRLLYLGIHTLHLFICIALSYHKQLMLISCTMKRMEKDYSTQINHLAVMSERYVDAN